MDTPRLKLLESGAKKDRTLVFVNGYTSQNDLPDDEGFAEWITMIRDAGWRGSIRHLWWDASCTASVLKPFNFSKVRRRAVRVGQNYAPALLRKLYEPKITLLGYSLGARIVFETLISIAGTDLAKRLQDAIFLGGALRRDDHHDWPAAADVLRGRLVNVYNGRDSMLYLWKLSHGRNHNPCGRKPIEAAHPQIVNVPVPTHVRKSRNNHKKYRNVLPQTVGALLWQSAR